MQDNRGKIRPKLNKGMGDNRGKIIPDLDKGMGDNRGKILPEFILGQFCRLKNSWHFSFVLPAGQRALLSLSQAAGFEVLFLMLKPHILNTNPVLFRTVHHSYQHTFFYFVS